MKTLAIIPARMAATRYPGKPMVSIEGMPMIEHIWRRVKLANCFDHVAVATCDREIYDHIKGLGGEAVMTSHSHERCTDRTAEALQIIEKDQSTQFSVIGMIQGDEPLVDPEVFAKTIKQMLSGHDAPPVFNIIGSIGSDEEFHSPNVVKVVTDLTGRALYFTRQAVPTDRKGVKTKRLRQTGLIFFLRDFLLQYNRMPSTILEQAESVDMMRVLENGIPIQTVYSDLPCLPIDVPGDLALVEKHMRQDHYFSQYRIS